MVPLALHLLLLSLAIRHCCCSCCRLLVFLPRRDCRDRRYRDVPVFACDRYFVLHFATGSWGCCLSLGWFSFVAVHFVLFVVWPHRSLLQVTNGSLLSVQAGRVLLPSLTRGLVDLTFFGSPSVLPHPARRRGKGKRVSGGDLRKS